MVCVLIKLNGYRNCPQKRALMEHVRALNVRNSLYCRDVTNWEGVRPRHYI